MPTRKHLYKAKRKDTGEWVKGDLVTYKNGDCYIFVEELTGALHGYFVDPETVCECTGLPDKNGNKIFEHDVCRDSLGTLFVVEWDSENARFIGFTIEKQRRLIYISREPRVEIIGNIYDNPELVEAKA